VGPVLRHVGFPYEDKGYGMNTPVYVTRTRMPSLQEYSRQLSGVFDAAWITNGGDCVLRLEQALRDYLHVPHLLLCNNGTTALMLVLQCAGLAGKKVAVTPYTYVATLSAALWMGCTPVFVDVDPGTLCLSPEKLRQAFNRKPDIAGVIPVHVYGLPCDVDGLETVCREHGATLVYDAAQAFGSTFRKKSLLAYGDYSICSFHATKIFHTAEGGCVICRTREAQEQLELARAFGHRGDTHIRLGINAKLSELHAAMGLALLPGTTEEIGKRRKLIAAYDAALDGLPLGYPVRSEGWNSVYYPVLLPDEGCLLRVTAALEQRNIRPRRYFYPALNTLDYLRPEWRTPCPVAEDAAKRVLCLPLYGDMPGGVVEETAEALRAEV